MRNLGAAKQAASRARHRSPFALQAGSAQPADIAALSITYAAAADDVVGGGYYGPDRFFGMRGLPAPAKAGRAATDQALMTANWVAAEHHTGVRYDI